MLTDPVLQWAFTIGFGLISVYLVGRVVKDRRQPMLLISHFLHLFMAVVMIAMSWPWWNALPWWPQLILFGAATLWFVVLVVLAVARLRPSKVGAHQHAWHDLHHAVMMGAMFWMVLAMPPGHHEHAHHLSTGHTMALPEWQQVAGLVLTVSMIVAAIIEALDLVTARRRILEGLTMILMLVGMALMCAIMLAR